MKYCKPQAGGEGDWGPGVREFRSMLVCDTTQNINNKSIKKSNFEHKCINSNCFKIWIDYFKLFLSKSRLELMVLQHSEV